MFCDKGAAVFRRVYRFPECDQTLEIFQPAARNRAVASQSGMGFDDGDGAGLTPTNAAFVAFLTRGVRRVIQVFPLNIIELNSSPLLALVLLKRG